MLRFVRRPKRSATRAQAIVEGAILLPTLIIITLGGTSINSYIQAQSQLNQAVSRGALVAARDAYDPCMPQDEPGAPPTSGGQPHGYQDTLDAFKGAMTSPLFSTGSTSTLKITCTSADGLASVTTTTVNGGIPTVSGAGSIPSWSGWASLQPGNWTGGTGCVGGVPQDGGCFAMWRGGTVKVTYSTTLQIHWTPFWHSVTISASAGEQIEPFRSHSCPNPPINGSPAC
jgi:TadE-like protein